jgi:acyl-CoA thioester hydrolase
LVVETKFINSPAAKITFEYTIYRESDMELLVKAKTIQVFTDRQGQLILTSPEFFMDWKKSLSISD